MHIHNWRQFMKVVCTVVQDGGPRVTQVESPMFWGLFYHCLSTITWSAHCWVKGMKSCLHLVPLIQALLEIDREGQKSFKGLSMSMIKSSVSQSEGWVQRVSQRLAANPLQIQVQMTLTHLCPFQSSLPFQTSTECLIWVLQCWCLLSSRSSFPLFTNWAGASNLEP